MLAATTWVQIAFGALVRAKKAGLACPDWPLCHGALVPDLKLTGVVYEYGHRVFALLVSALFVWCAMQARRDAAAWARVRSLVWGGAGLLLVQIVFGGLTVLIVHRGDGDPRPAAWTVATHLVLGNLFAALAVVGGLALRAPHSASSGRPPKALVAWTVLLLVQFALGGAIAGTIAGLVCTEFPTCHGGIWFPTFEGTVGWQVLHRLNAYALTVVAITAALSWNDRPGLRKVAWMLVGLVVAQATVGAVNIYSYLHAAVTTAHSLLAALLFSVTAAAWYLAKSGDQAHATADKA
ncbi:MAG: COX15/CtaA family protein [Deltaproteobacteria bacterium]|nr:COX15/CtaA family protein [Deltaproteobacteria bacterium]